MRQCLSLFFAMAGAAVCGSQWSAPERPPQGTVSLKQLMHRTPPEAEARYAASRKALKAGDLTGAIHEIEQAIRLDPGNLEAHNDLGVLYMDANEPGKAVDQFTEMLQLDPRCSMAHRNLSVAFYALKKFADAERAARRAVELDRLDPKGRLLLGMSLMGQSKLTQEALDNLLAVEREYPEARLPAAILLLQFGRLEEAQKELDEFLKNGNMDQRPVAEAWRRLITIE